MTHRLWVVSDLVALLEAEEGKALMEEDLDDDLEDLDDEPVGDWRKLLWYFALFFDGDCGAWIELPYSLLQLTDEDGLTLLRGEDLPKLPSEGQSAVFGCHKCGRVERYAVGEVLVQPIPKVREGIYQSGKGVYFAGFPCGDKDCKTPASMSLDIGHDNARAVLAVLRSAPLLWISPFCGHEMKPVPERYYRIEVMRKL